jgi:hypothetical protein
MNQYLLEVKRFLRTILTTFLLLALRPFAKNLTLAYWSDKGKDGLGAQVQRQISTYGLSRFLKCGYLHSEISYLPFHPLDGFDTSESRECYLKESNSFLSFESDVSSLHDTNSNFKTVYMEKLVLGPLLRLILTSTKNHKILLYIDEPFLVADYCSSVKNIHPSVLYSKLPAHCRVSDRNHKHVIVHYRSGTGRFDKYGQQAISRQQDLQKLQLVLETISWELTWQGICLIILTDAPENDIDISIPDRHIRDWIHMPGYKNGKLHITGISDKDFQKIIPLDFKSNLKIIRGGNPINALTTMINADYLLMSRSSLSYVAAILNKKGIVFYPKDFWHPKKKSWRKY